MRKLLILAIISLIGFTNCEKKKPNINPYAQIALNAMPSKAIPNAPYPIDTMISYAWELSYFADSEFGHIKQGQLAVDHDLIKKKIRFGAAVDVVNIDKEGNPYLGWIPTSNLNDLVIIAVYHKNIASRWVHFSERGKFTGDEIDWTRKDTIGYVPNSVIKKAEAEIKTAFANEDYDKCMQLFETAYLFQPITGAQWRALKAKNEQ